MTRQVKRILNCLCRRAIGIATCITLFSVPSRAAEPAVPILVYHRFGTVRTDAMTVTTEHFREQLDLLSKNHFNIIPLSEVLAWRLGHGPAPPSGSVVLTFDDGHASVYREARPIVVARRLPVTLFLYPSCISRATYAMTWDQVRELAGNPLFNVESHTYWHPNFKHESKRMATREYNAFVDNQLQRSKAVLENQLHRPMQLLAWPFGIYDPFLMQRAAAAGYQAGFSIDNRAATLLDPVMSLPRCLVSDEYTGQRFLQFLKDAMASAKH